MSASVHLCCGCVVMFPDVIPGGNTVKLRNFYKSTSTCNGEYHLLLEYITVEFPLWLHAPLGYGQDKNFVSMLQLQADCNGGVATVSMNGSDAIEDEYEPDRFTALALCRDETGTCLSEQEVSCWYNCNNEIMIFI